jgi:hypothetical protein
MNRLPLFVCCVVAVAAGCKKDATFTEPLPNYAHVNWLNAVQDTMQLSVRIVDIISNASFMNRAFRDAQFFPLSIEPGARHFKVFLSSSIDTIAKRFILDTTYTFAEGQDYSFYLIGQARAGRPQPFRAMITNLTLPSPGAGKFAIRVLNLAPSLGGALAGTLPDTSAAPDVYILASNATPGTPSGASLAFGSATQYVVLDTGAYYIALTAPGTVTPKAVVGTVPPGTARDPSTGTPAIAGSHIEGSVFTAIIVPHSDTTSLAPKTRAGQGALQITDTSVSEAARRITFSGDTVTVQVGSSTRLVNRRVTGGGRLADTTLTSLGTGTKAASPVIEGSTILVSGVTQPEYNGWQAVMIADSLICSPADPGDVATGPNKHCQPPADTTVASADTAFTRFRFRYRIVGAPPPPTFVPPGPQYRVYPSTTAATDFIIPQFLFMVDKRPQ